MDRRIGYFLMMAEAASARLSEGVRRVSSLTRGVSSAYVFMFFLMLMAGLLYAVDVFAWTTPTSGSFLYDAYDIAVNKFLKGAPGFLLGMGLIGYGGHAALDNQRTGWGKPVLALIAGGCLVKLDTITTTLGFYV